MNRETMARPNPHAPQRAAGTAAASGTAVQLRTLDYSEQVQQLTPRDGPPQDHGPVQLSESDRRTEHAKERGEQGRRTGPAFNDAQRARMADVFIQDDGRWVLRGPKAREHIFLADGQHLTSIDRSDAAHRGKVEAGERQPATASQYEEFKKVTQ